MALTKANKKNKSRIFNISHIAPGINVNGKISKGDNQPPKNKIAPIAHINKIFALALIILLTGCSIGGEKKIKIFSVEKPREKLN